MATRCREALYENGGERMSVVPSLASYRRGSPVVFASGANSRPLGVVYHSWTRIIADHRLAKVLAPSSSKGGNMSFVLQNKIKK